jgi:hypothetical protein
MSRIRASKLPALAPALILLSGSAACHPQGAPSQSTIPSWSEPSALAGIPDNQLLRWPNLVSVRDTVYVAANLLPIKGREVGKPSLYLARLPGGPMALPTGDFQFVYPKLAAGANGQLHLIWAEFDSTQSDVGSFSMARPQASLWHAAFADGVWTRPEEIFRGTNLQWTSEDGHASIDPSGSVHVVAWAHSGVIRGLFEAARTGGKWNVVPIDQASVRPSAAIDAGGNSTLIAFDLTYSPDDSTGLSVLKRESDGRWIRRRVTEAPGPRPVRHPQFVHSRGTTYLVWAESQMNAFGIDTLRLSRVVDGPRTIPVAAIGLPDGAASFTAAANSCGGITALIETIVATPRVIEMTIAENGSARLRPVLPDGQSAAFAAIGTTSKALIAVMATQPSAGAVGRMVSMTRAPCTAQR